jgi:esterase/lipase superfamily enzyme
MIRVFVVVCLAIVTQPLAAHAQDKWVRLARVEVPAGAEDVKLDEAWRWKGRYKAIRWQASRGTTHMEAMAVAYSACRSQVLNRPRSNVVVLDRPESFIDGLYLLLNKSRRPRTLEVWGLQGDADAAAVRETYPLSAGFQIDFTADRQAVHDCPDSYRQYSEDQIVLEASGSDIRLRSLKITYETDQTELIEIDADLAQGAKTEVFRMNSASRFRRLELAYDPRPGFTDSARVAVRLSSSSDLLEKNGRGGPPQMHVCYFPCGAPEVCVYNATCTPIMIFFGTNRQRSDQAGRIGFGPERGDGLSLGRAIVTVPRYHGIGKVERPGFWASILSFDLVLAWQQGEDPERHFTIPANGIEVFASPDEFVEAMRRATGEQTDFRDHAFIYVHGFKVEFDNALFRLAQMAYDLGVDRNHSRIPFGMPFLFSWPARGGLLDYVTDRESAELAETHLRTFLELVVTQSKAKHVHLIAHSMGSQPVLKVLAEFAATRPDIRFNQIVLAAPDVDRRQFLEIARRVRPAAENVTLYASSRDEAMLASRNLHSGLPRAGDVPADGPVVVRGVDTIDVSGLSTELFAASHNKYAEDMLLLKDIGALLRSGVRPPHDRTPVLRRTPVGEEEFWVYRK